MANRLSQEALEALISANARGILSQEAIEALIATSSTARVSQMAVEVLMKTGEVYESSPMRNSRYGFQDGPSLGFGAYVAGASGTQSSVANGSTVTITKPAGTTHDDTLIMVVALKRTSGTPPTLAAPSGWTKISDASYTESGGSNGCRHYVFHRRVIPGDGSTYSVSASGGSSAEAAWVISCYRGVEYDTGSVTDLALTASSTTDTPTPPTSTAGRDVPSTGFIVTCSTRPGLADATGSSGTLRSHVDSSGGIAAATADIGTPSAVAATIVWASANSNRETTSLILRPKAAGVSDSEKETLRDTRTGGPTALSADAETITDTRTSSPALVNAEADLRDNTRAGSPTVVEATAETLLDTRTGVETISEPTLETIDTSATNIPSIVETVAIIDTLDVLATNVPSLTDEQAVTAYVADVLTNTRTGQPSLLNDGYVDELENTRTGQPRIADDSDSLRNTRTGVQSIVEIIDTGFEDTLTNIRTGVERISEIIDSTEDTLSVSQTNIPSISERFINTNLLPTGPGTGGEIGLLRLAPAGVEVYVHLVGNVTSSAGSFTVDDASGLPDDGSFILVIEDEEILVGARSGNTMIGCRRGMGNTLPAAHHDGVSARWTDTYNMAITSTNGIFNEVVGPINLDIAAPSGLLTCFLIAADCSQAYNTDGDRYATHVRSFVGVFPPRTGNSNLSLSRTDGPQPNSVTAADGLTDRVPAALSIPARLRDDVEIGDVAVVRYKNTEDYILVLGPRSVLVQAWYGVIRVDGFNAVVTETDPNGHSTDGYISQTYPDSDSIVAATLPASSRHFTRTSVGRPGILFSALTVRQENRRVPLWTSPNWHNFDWVFNGFGTDRNFVQIVARRKHVDLPSDSNLTGPNATWDDPTYLTSTGWHVMIIGFEADAAVAGPPFNGNPPPNPPVEVIIIPPTGSVGGGGVGGGWTPPGDPDEGGSGGDIDQGPEIVGVFADTEIGGFADIELSGDD